MGNRHISSLGFGGSPTGSSYMGNMQCAILFKQRPQALPSMIYFPFMTKIVLYVQLATLFFCPTGNTFFLAQTKMIWHSLLTLQYAHWEAYGHGSLPLHNLVSDSANPS